jgi:hypothetical protein
MKIPLIPKHRRAFYVSSIAIVAAFLFNSCTHAGPKSDLWDFWENSNSAESRESSQTSIDHSTWQSFLNEYLVTNDPSGINLVRYEAIATQGSQGLNLLNQYIALLEAVDPRSLSKNEQFAYWVNLYNATTVRVIANAYPVKSIRKTGKGLFSFGPWDDVVTQIAGKGVTLNDIEHRILRPFWKDSRIHFVVNCASIGCPNLHQTALTADNHQVILDQARRSFINHPRAVSVANGELHLSSIFDWYADDFGNSQSEVLEYLATYLNRERSDSILSVIQQPKADVKYSYDWSLNLAK